MKPLRLLASLAFFLALLLAADGSGGAERGAPTWGWRDDEGLGAPRKRPVPAQNAWQPKSGAPQPGDAPTSAAAVPSQPPPAPAPQPPANVKAYCENIADPALDARFQHQKAELARLEEELVKKTALLETKQAEFQQWMKRRDEFISKAQDGLLKLYAKIKPDAAAPQLAAMDEEAAAALLLKLSARTSSAILDEMDSAKAARLVSVMIGAARPSDKPAAPTQPVASNVAANPAGVGGSQAAKPLDNGKS